MIKVDVIMLINLLKALKYLTEIGEYEHYTSHVKAFTHDDYPEYIEYLFSLAAPETGEYYECEHTYWFASPEMKEYHMLCDEYGGLAGINEDSNPYYERAVEYGCACFRNLEGDYAACLGGNKATVQIDMFSYDFAAHEIVQAIKKIMAYYHDNLPLLRDKVSEMKGEK